MAVSHHAALTQEAIMVSESADSYSAAPPLSDAVIMNETLIRSHSKSESLQDSNGKG